MSYRQPGLLRCCVVAALTAGALSACDLPGIASSTPTATPAQASGALPTGWQVYKGVDFSIDYPPDWSLNLQAPPTGSQGQGIVLSGPQASDTVTIIEEYGFTDSDIVNLCKLGEGETPTHLAGLPMTYTLGEGVYRTWFFMNSAHQSYSLTVLDGNQPQSVQKQHNAILATFQPNDMNPGCV
ncbi:MAG TPA: hypothetical protein VF808_11400 [Ktedonobacterales bacterium]